MAIQKLFIEKTHTEWKKLGNSMSTEYLYNGKHLNIKWKNAIKTYPANIGDAFVVNCDGAFPKVSPLKPPRSTGEKLLWLTSFNKKTRATSEKDVKERVKLAEKYGWWGHKDYHFHKEEKWYLVFGNRKGTTGFNHIAGWVNDDLTKEDIIEFINQFRSWFYFPEWYINKFIKENFDITLNDLAKQKFPNLPSERIFRHDVYGTGIYYYCYELPEHSYMSGLYEETNFERGYSYNYTYIRKPEKDSSTVYADTPVGYVVLRDDVEISVKRDGNVSVTWDVYRDCPIK